MPNNCGACGSIIQDLFMECSNGKCNVKYDLACLEINKEAFMAYTQAYKNNWTCPECVCSKPKRGNSDIPVMNTPDFKLNIATPISNVNLQRGSQSLFTPTVRDADSVLLEELREFRSDMVARMDSQAKTISLLLNQFSQTQTEMTTVVKMMRVLEEKVEAKLSQERPTQDAVNESSSNPPPPPASTSTLAEIVSRKSSFNVCVPKKTSSTYTTAQNVHHGGATKSAGLPVKTMSIVDPLTADDTMKAGAEDSELGWTTVRNKKNNRQPKDVRVGTNLELKAILATERKKHLHVWRLHPETSVEAITDHVKNICGPNVAIKIDKIKHKTERDYSSFIVGVPEKCFENINQAEIWPMNAEFSEWIWFRKSTKTMPNE